MKRISTTISFLYLLLAINGSGLQAGHYDFSSGEIALLPSYCQGKLGGKKSAITFNKKDWAHGHHYCYALVFLNRAITKTVPNLNLAISNFNYVDRRWSQSFVLRPQMHLHLGGAHQKAGNNAEAAQNFMKAVLLKPKHPAGYLALSRSYEKMGAKDEAIQTLEDGLKRVPEAKSGPLKRNLSRLKK